MNVRNTSKKANKYPKTRCFINIPLNLNSEVNLSSVSIYEYFFTISIISTKITLCIIINTTTFALKNNVETKSVNIIILKETIEARKNKYPIILALLKIVVSWVIIVNKLIRNNPEEIHIIENPINPIISTIDKK